MTNPTTPFSWQMPTASDLVTDLPADFETFGQAVATSMADLLGGTTGQILAKNSNTDMDFTWITNDQGDITAVNTTAPLAGGGTSGALTLSIASATTSVAGAVQLSDSTSTTSSVLAATPTAVKSAYDLANGAIPKTLIDAAGDLIVGTAADTAGRLAIGTANQVLKVNSGATGLEWGTAGGGGKVLQVVQDTLETNYSTASATYNDTGLTVTITPSSATSKIMIMSYARVSITSTGTKTGNYGSLRLVVGATPTVLQEQSIGMGVMSSTVDPEFYINVNFSLLHSPATTSATTYKIQGKTANNSNTAITGNGTSINSIVVMEIGA